MLEEYITRVGINGILELDPGIMKKISGKKVKIIVYSEKEKNAEKKSNPFLDLLQNGPKAEGKIGLLTREWIYSRDDNEQLYR
jgi:hypothetical protein